VNGGKKLFLIFAGVVLAAAMATVFAQPNCDLDSLETPDLLMCSQQTFDSLDVALNAQYKKALASLSPDDKQLLVDVQRSWVKFKEGWWAKTTP